jgi:hypothetical protein
MALIRQTSNPSRTLILLLVRQELQAMMPTEFQWFTEDKLLPGDAALGQYLAGLAEVLADLYVEAVRLRYSTTLQTAAGQLLDLVGQGYGISRALLEDDDTYANRIQTELLLKRITKPNILAGLLQLVPAAELFEPWRRLAIPSKNWIPSEGWYPPSRDYWAAAVFEARIYGSASTQMSALHQFFEVMKAYGVKYWIADYVALGAIDYHDDPLLPAQVVPTLPNGLSDPRVVSRENLIVGSTLDIITEVVGGPEIAVSYPSGPYFIPSKNWLPSGHQEDNVFVLELVSDLLLSMAPPLFSGDLVPAALLDWNSPNIEQIILDGFTVPDPTYNPVDILDSRYIDEDLEASEVAGTSLPFINTCELIAAGARTDFQAPCLIEQLP